MLPGDHKPWAKSLATTVIVFTIIGCVGLALYFNSIGSFHISEMVGIFLVLLTIIPPNAAIVMRKPDEAPLGEHGQFRRNITP